MNPDTEEAAALARFLLQLTGGLGIRELSEKFPGTAGRSQWGLWLRADKDVPLEVLRQLIEARLPAEQRAKALQRATMLCARAEASRAGRGRPVPAQHQRQETETVQAYKELAAARQGLLEAREALYRSKNLVLMLLWMIESLNSRIKGLQTRPQPPTAPGPTRFRSELARAEDQLRRSETELRRAREERDRAQRLHAAAQQHAEELECRMADLAQNSAPIAPAPQAEEAGLDGEPTADEYDVALERVATDLDANAHDLRELQERLEGAEGPSARAPARHVVREEILDNVDNVESSDSLGNSVAMTGKRAPGDGPTGHVVRGEALSRTATDNPVTSLAPMSWNSKRPSTAPSASEASGEARALIPADAARTPSARTDHKMSGRSGGPQNALSPDENANGQCGAGHGTGSRPQYGSPVIRNRRVRAVSSLAIGVTLLLGVTASQREPGMNSQNSLPTVRPSGAPSGRPATAPKGTVHLRSDAALAAVDTAKGTKRWSRPGAASGTEIVADVSIYSSQSGGVKAIDSATGKERWSTSLKQEDLSVFAVTSDTVYVNSRSGLTALDTTTGKEKWIRNEIAGEVVHDGTVYGGTFDADLAYTVYSCG
ncbi:PQQ-binding-like beta-propeller repeat protein [Streptomyces typhae]|uniref:outer membrane protein assembly factor BamB family protein n=1 Tax=Streptomyces typhae TaxID=2681492 RepID=UPI0012F6D914|nr:PQQ-binding-like beta-propeller repeat protein [Streptomyces typhae]